ncbi:hypothetical protein JIN82_12780 [Persicirhabdus sediminis]|uniref:Cysteine-rich secretory protein family protein n=1 Tax=Persicirhabdus sediminis TaxID=454144 RepID=A0A8J7MJ95_9BACT|nr:hypothetical protein [Persicirhabdus sediminis]
MSGFTVDTTSRNDVASFYHSVYAESEAYKTRSNDWYGGSYSGNNHGSTTQALKDDVQRRVNFYRAMAGVPANIDFSSTHTVAGSDADTFYPGAATTKQAAAQRAAFMMSAGNNTSHNPSSSWPKFTFAGWNGAQYSNLSVGLYGPGAMDAYMRENDPDSLATFDASAGHRRWILYTRATTMATGDTIDSVEGSVLRYAANALYIFQRQEEKLDVSQQFVPWPNQGYFPDKLVPTHWSLGRWGADFSAAAVSVTDQDGNPMSLTITDADPNVFKGDNSIVWKLDGVSNSVAEDAEYHVTVSNILIGGVAEAYSYKVTVFNVDGLGEDQSLAGTQIPPVSGARYTFESVDDAEEHEFQVTQIGALSQTWNAEGGSTVNLWDGTGSEYTLTSNWLAANGSRSYRLGFSRYSRNSEMFGFERTMIPQSGATLSFKLRRAYMMPTAVLSVEISAGYAKWESIADYAGSSEYIEATRQWTITDGSFIQRSVAIPVEYIGEPVLIRFRIHKTESFCFPAETANINGAFLDNISLSNSKQLVPQGTTSYSGDASVVSFDSSSAGGSLQDGVQYILRKRTRMGNYWYPYGPMLTVVPDGALVGWEAWKEADFSGIDSFSDDDDGDGLGNGLEFALGLDPTNAFDTGTVLKPYVEDGYLVLESPFSGNLATMGVELRGQYSQDLELWANSGVAEVVDGKIRIKVDLDLDARFFRWKVDVLATP